MTSEGISWAKISSATSEMHGIEIRRKKVEINVSTENFSPKKNSISNRRKV